MKVVIISAVRDYDMYDKCISANPNCRGCELVPYDNREKNESIPVLYNRFLDSRPADEDAWYVFCHEDFEPLEPLPEVIAKADRGSLWGPIGVITRRRFFIYEQWHLCGTINGCARDGSNPIRIGHDVSCGTPVDTFDCQCLIVHSSLIVRAGLRFDEHLTFDLYLEDICIAANERHGIKSRILPFACRHWSDSIAKSRYYTQKAYLDRKFPDCCYTGSCSWAIGGRPSIIRRLNIAVKSAIKFTIKSFRRK